MTVRGKTSVLELSRGEWNSLAPGFSDLSFEQSYGYALASAARLGGRLLLLKVHAGSSLLGLACVRLKTVPVLQQGIAYIAAGPLLSDGSSEGQPADRLDLVTTALKRYLVDERGHILRIRLPLLPPALPASDADALLLGKGFQRTDRVRAYRTIAVDLTPSEDKLLKNLDGKWRTDLNFARKANLSVDVGSTADLLSRFQSLYVSMRKKKGFSSTLEPDFFFRLQPESIGLRVMVARKDGRDAAGHVESTLGASAIYLFGASNETGREAKAAYLLNWLALVHARERGTGWYDLGGIDPVANPGVSRFKGRMGGEEMEAAGPYEARPSGFIASALLGLETARARLRQA